MPPGSYTSGAVILISDGRRTTGPDPVEIAKIAADYGVRVFTVGFGTLGGSLVGSEDFSFWARLDEPTLKAVAAMTGAEYFHAGTAADLRKVYESLSTKFAMERREDRSQRAVQRRRGTAGVLRGAAEPRVVPPARVSGARKSRPAQR